jgi:hypothetical protein
MALSRGLKSGAMSTVLLLLLIASQAQAQATSVTAVVGAVVHEVLPGFASFDLDWCSR